MGNTAQNFDLFFSIFNDFIKYLFSYFGENLRKFGPTSLNDESSRSHTVFRLHFEIRNKERPDKINFAIVNLVDLAGSEGVSRAKTEGMRKRYQNIKFSFFSLKNFNFFLKFSNFF